MISQSESILVQKKPISFLAVVSFILGFFPLINTFIWGYNLGIIGPVSIILDIVIAIIALNQIKRGKYRGRLFAIAGITFGIINIIPYILLLLAFGI